MTFSRKIGVLTFHRCINYGSYWQARCLVEGLRAKGFEAELLDHRSGRVDRAEWRCALTPHLPAPTPAHDRAAYARKARRFIEAIAALPLSPAFDLERPGSLEDYDLVLVGSDEVWNLRHPWYGGHRLFYGSGLSGGRVAAYAASFGNYPASDGLDPQLARLLEGFAAISVRDDNSSQLIRSCLGRKPELVLDPCLQFPEIATHEAEVSDDVAVIYGHGFPAWFAARILAWARATRRRLVSIGYRNDWADEQRLELAPEDFPRWIAGSAAVVTNFFHGSVFALLHGRPFVCSGSDYRSIKLRSLVAQLDAVDHLVSPEAPTAAYHAALDHPLGTVVGRRIAELRARSTAYLDHVLQ